MVLKRISLTLSAAFLMASGMFAGQPEWQDPLVNSVNRAPMHTSYFAYANDEEAASLCPENSSNYMSINGTWKFFWTENADERPTDFWHTDFNDRGWDDMQVPGIWELNGYGDPLYNNIGYAWQYQFRNNPPEVPVENNHVGSYRRTVIVPTGPGNRFSPISAAFPPTCTCG